MPQSPTIIVFDVNETLLDITVLEPLFDRLFGDRAVMRQWFAELILYAEAVTLADRYLPFGEIAAGVLRMVGTVRGRTIETTDVAALRESLQALPAYGDVEGALHRLAAAGFRLVTLTNSPPSPGESPLEKAGLADLFERHFSVDSLKRFKPATAVYRMVEQELGCPSEAFCLVAAHTWDTLGAQAAGWSAALVTRPGNAVLPIAGLLQPQIVAPDMAAAAERIVARWVPFRP